MEPDVRGSRNVFSDNRRLDHCDHGLTDDDVKEVASTIKECHDITELDLSDNSIEEKGCMYLSAVLPDTRIQELNLSSNRIGCQGVKHLCQCLKNTEIAELFLEEIELGDDGVANLAQGLEGSNVRDLYLASNDIGPRGAFHLCQVLPRSRIQTLDLSSNHIGNEGAKLLGKCFKFTQISKLYIEYNDIEDEGLFHFAQGLKGNHMKFLNLSGNHFGDHCLRSLVDELKDTPIGYISLDNISIDVAPHLHASFHESKLENYCLKVSTSKCSNCFIQRMNSWNGIKMYGVHLRNYDIGFDGAAYLNELFKEFPLHTLRFYNQELRADHVQCLAQAFQNIKIDFLEPRKCHLAQVDGMRFLVEIFKTSQISSIHLPYQNMESSDFQSLAGFLYEILILELCLSHSNLNDECIICLVRALRTNAIIKLDLSSNQMTSTGMEYLAPIFEHNRITHLDLSGNAIGDLGAKHLSDYLKHSQLKRIDLSDNGITEVGYQHLVRATEDSNVCLIRCSPLPDIQRDKTATTAFKVCSAFKTLVALCPLSGEYQFVLSKENHDLLIDEYVFFLKVLTEHPQVEAHIFNMMCFRETYSYDSVDFCTMNKLTKFIDKLSDKFNEFFNENLPAFPACDYVELTKKFEGLQLFEIVQNLLLHRELFYVDNHKEILHSYIYKLLYKYKMPLYNEELEPNKKNAIIAFYEKFSEDDDAKALLSLFRRFSSKA